MRQPFRPGTRFLRVLLVLAACGAAAGCGPTLGATPAPSGALALVVGGHANAPEPAPLPPVRALLEQAADQAWQTTEEFLATLDANLAAKLA